MTDKIIRELEGQRKSLEANLDKVFEEYIRKLYGYACVISGEKRNAKILYMIDPVKYPGVRWDAENAYLVCNRVYKKYMAGDTMEFLEWGLLHIGKERAKLLYMKADLFKPSYTIQEIVNFTNKYILMTLALPKSVSSNGR